jgi:hypothetical protein
MNREHLAQLIRDKGYYAQVESQDSVHCAQKLDGDKFVGVNFTVIKDESRWEIAVGGRLYRCPNGSNILDISLDLLSGPSVALTALPTAFCKTYGIVLA